MRNKKGNLIDLPYVVVMITIFALTLVIMHFVLTEMHTMASSTGVLNASLIQKGIDTFSIFDKGVSLILVALILGTAISAFFIDSHPVFFVVSLFFLVVTVFVAAQFTNLFHAAIYTPPLNQSRGTFPLTLQTMHHLPTFIGLGGIIVSFALYSKVKKWIMGGGYARA